jgi:diacylglycerol kinase family enzyme
MKNYLLYNPLAGNGRGHGYIDELKERLEGEVVLCDVTTPEGYKDILSGIESDDLITICGGDGTLNKFVNTMDVDGMNNTILYYAAGSGNDFLCDVARDRANEVTNITKYLKNLPTVTVKGKSYKFINGVGYGIDGYCCEVGDKMREAGDKKIDYTMIAIKGLLFHFKPADATITVDGKEYFYKKVWIAPTMHGRCYGGGMIPTPNQDRLNPEGSVSVMAFHGTSKLKTLMIFPSLFKGEHIKHTEAIAIHEGKEITVKFSHPASLQIDGETILDVSEYTVHAGVLAKV